MKPWAYTLIPLACTPLFAHGSPLTLQTAMTLSEQNSHAAKSATFASEEAGSKLKQSWSALGPRLDVEATAAKMDGSVNGLVGKQIGTQDIPDKVEQAAVVATQPLTGLGPMLLRVRSETLLARAAEHQKEQSARNARYAGGEAFLRASKADQLLRIAKASMAVAEKQKNDGNALAQVGKLKQSDLLRLDLAVSDAQTQLTQAESLRDVTFYSLAELTGIPANELDLADVTESDSLRSNTPISRDAAALIEKAQNNRSEIHALDAAQQSLELSRKALWFEYLPQLNLFARYDHDFAKKDLVTPPAHIHNPSTGAAISISQTRYAAKDIASNFSYGLSLRWNAWDWGNRYFRESEIIAKAAGARENLEQLRQATRIEVMQAHRDLRAATDSLASANATLKFAEEFYRQTNARFLIGMASVLDLTSAERDQTRARAALSNARGDWDMAALKLKKVVGDGTF